MRNERRNFYRTLHVQPEAPQAVIKAAWRALMAALHPDAGGTHEAASQLNAAYETLSDPARRAAYDRTLRRPARAAAAGAPGAPPSAASAAPGTDWLNARRCPFCATPFSRLAGAEPVCSHCAAPLVPAPLAAAERAELVGRRRAQRIDHRVPAALQLAGQAPAFRAEMCDLSLSGARLRASVGIAPGAIVRLRTASLHAVARVVASRRDGPAYVLHLGLITLQRPQTTAPAATAKVDAYA
jgi:hypothetical protein